MKSARGAMIDRGLRELLRDFANRSCQSEKRCLRRCAVWPDLSAAPRPLCSLSPKKTIHSSKQRCSIPGTFVGVRFQTSNMGPTPMLPFGGRISSISDPASRSTPEIHLGPRSIISPSLKRFGMSPSQEMPVPPEASIS